MANNSDIIKELQEINSQNKKIIQNNLEKLGDVANLALCLLTWEKITSSF